MYIHTHTHIEYDAIEWYTCTMQLTISNPHDLFTVCACVCVCVYAYMYT